MDLDGFLLTVLLDIIVDMEDAVEHEGLESEERSGLRGPSCGYKTT